MAKVYNEKMVVAIDVGTTKICVLVARYHDLEHLEILGIGRTPSEGLKKGVVVDVAKTIHSIKTAVKEAELMAGMTIDGASIGISGGHIQSLSSQGMVPIKRGEVQAFDIHNALEAAKAIPLPEGMQLLHALPQFFTIDGHTRVQDPLSMHGIRLEVQAHLILGAVASVQNLIKCCEMAGVKVTDIILEQLASADAVLTPDERELGVALLDIGGGTSDLALYQQGAIRHTMVLPVAGNHFTNDIAVGLRTSIAHAEKIKKEFGCAYQNILKEEEVFEVESVHGKSSTIMQSSDLIKILEPRAREICLIVRQEIVKHHLQSFIVAGLVLTGGGSLLQGMRELAESIFNVPVRIGSPQLHHAVPPILDNPMYATGYGLLLHTITKSQTSLDTLSGPLLNRLFSRMKSWVSDFF